MGCCSSNEVQTVGIPCNAEPAEEEKSDLRASSHACFDGLADHTGSPTQLTIIASPDEISAAKGTSGEHKWLGKLFTRVSDMEWMTYRVLSFLPVSQSVVALFICRASYDGFKPRRTKGPFWRHMCETLCAQSLLFLPSDDASLILVARGGQFKTLFEELWPARSRFVAIADSAPTNSIERFRVQTFCRMRPEAPVKLDGFLAADLLVQSAPVQLPLSQRAALLRKKNPSLTHAAALKLLLNKQCGAGSPLPEDDYVLPGSSEEMGPETAAVMGEAKLDCLHESSSRDSGTMFSASVLSVSPGPKGSVLTMSPGIGLRSWSFDRVFGASSTQRELYEQCGLRLATNLMNGQSGALIAYGQTGSGKTHTMFGASGSTDGLVHRITDDVLQNVARRRCMGFEALLGTSMVEVFGNDVSNLLGGEIGGNRGENQRMGHRYILGGHCEEAVEDRETFARLLARGEERKRSAKTEMNERSTRAHTVVILRFRQRLSSEADYVESTLTLVDLGGAERLNKSKANEDIRAPGAINVGNDEVSRISWEEYYRRRERVSETNHINKGLLTLKRCVQALNERQQCVSSGKPIPRIPFHDSKLTMLLQPALCGEACTSLIVCCAPEDKHAEESVQTLRFGEMCSAVEHERSNAVRDVNAEVTKALTQLDDEIKDLESQILKKERWEWKMTVRQDFINEMNTAGAVCHYNETMELGGAGAVEIRADDGVSTKLKVEHKVWSQVAVGAEAENARRDELLATRQRLLGGP